MAGPSLPNIIAELSKLQDVSERNATLSEENSALTTANDHLTAELNQRNTKIDSLTAELAKVKGHSPDKRALSKLKAQVQGLQNEKDELKRRLDAMEQSLNTEKSASAQTIQELRANIAARDELNQIANSEADSAMKQAKDLEKKLADCNQARVNAMNQLGQSSQYYKNQISDLQAEVKTLRTKSDMLSSALRLNDDDIKRKVKQLETKEEDIKASKAQHNNQIAQWSHHSEKLKADNQGLHNALQRSQAEKSQLVTEYEEKVKSLDEKFLQSQNDVKGEVAAAEARAREAETMAKEVKAQYNNLNDTHQSFLLENVNLRNQLQSAQDEAKKRQAGQKSAEECQRMSQEIQSLQDRVKTLTRQKKDNCEAYRAIWEHQVEALQKENGELEQKLEGVNKLEEDYKIAVMRLKAKDRVLEDNIKIACELRNEIARRDKENIEAMKRGTNILSADEDDDPKTQELDIQESAAKKTQKRKRKKNDVDGELVLPKMSAQSSNDGAPVGSAPVPQATNAQPGTIPNMCRNEPLSPAEDSSPGSAASLPMDVNQMDGGQMVLPSIGENSEDNAAVVSPNQNGLWDEALCPSNDDRSSED